VSTTLSELHREFSSEALVWEPFGDTQKHVGLFRHGPNDPTKDSLLWVLSKHQLLLVGMLVT
jgi:hypothetical protein